MLLGYIIAELIHQQDIKKLKYNQLIAEYYQKQLWQFISIDEWLEAHIEKSRIGK